MDSWLIARPVALQLWIHLGNGYQRISNELPYYESFTPHVSLRDIQRGQDILAWYLWKHQSPRLMLTMGHEITRERFKIAEEQGI